MKSTRHLGPFARREELSHHKSNTNPNPTLKRKKRRRRMMSRRRQYCPVMKKASSHMITLSRVEAHLLKTRLLPIVVVQAAEILSERSSHPPDIEPRGSIMTTKSPTRPTLPDIVSRLLSSLSLAKSLRPTNN
jgi:hypothetical protein